MKLWRVFWEAEHQVFERGTVEAPTAIEARLLASRWEDAPAMERIFVQNLMAE
jgi:hypothetical protein